MTNQPKGGQVDTLAHLLNSYVEVRLRLGEEKTNEIEPPRIIYGIHDELMLKVVETSREVLGLLEKLINQCRFEGKIQQHTLQLCLQAEAYCVELVDIRPMIHYMPILPPRKPYQDYHQFNSRVVRNLLQVGQNHK